MDCDEAIDRLADTLGGASRDAELEVHLAACPACALAARDSADACALLLADALHDDHPPPVDRAALRVAAGLVPARISAGRALLRRAVRVAAVLLAGVGLAALFDAEIRVESGSLRVNLALPGSAAAVPEPQPSPRPTPAELDAAIGRRVTHLLQAPNGENPVRRVVDAELRPHLEELATWFVDTDRRRRDDLEFLAAWLEKRRESDANTLAQQLLETRSRLEDTRQIQSELIDAFTPVRFEPR
jgi:hypothetical protein